MKAPPATTAGDLDESDVRALCDYYQETAPTEEMTCRFLAVALTLRNPQGDEAVRRADCGAAETRCLQIYESTAAEVQADCESRWFGPTCAATVAEIERCMMDSGEKAERIIPPLGNCATVDMTIPPEQVPTLTPADSCIAAATKCPTLFSSESTGEGEPP